jgi:cytochrome c peroxidase
MRGARRHARSATRCAQLGNALLATVSARGEIERVPGTSGAKRAPGGARCVAFGDPMRAVHVIVLLSIVAVVGPSASATTSARDASKSRVRLTLLGTVAPLAEAPQLDERAQKRVALGRELYLDTVLSRNERVSCATCHPLDGGGTTPEGLTTRGVSGQPNGFNTPTTFNVSVNKTTAWRGDASDVAELLERPFFKDACMGNRTWSEITHRLVRTEGYAAKFAGAELSLDKEGVNGALVAYMEAITPRDAPLDRYLRGDDTALDDRAVSGAALFSSLGCVACHRGEGLGGDGFARFGVGVDPYAERGQCAEDGSYCRGSSPGCTCSGPSHVREQDLGVPPATSGDAPTYRFRVPSLRNVAVTAPYFHDGSARTLEEAVRTMARLQLNRTLTDAETQALVAFLSASTGALPPAELRAAAELAAAHEARRGAR